MKHDNETIPLSTSKELSAVEKLKSYIHQLDSPIEDNSSDSPDVPIENNSSESIDDSFNLENDSDIVTITTDDGSVITAQRIISSSNKIEDLTEHVTTSDANVIKKHGVRIKNPNRNTVVKKESRFSRKSIILLSSVAALSVVIAGAWLANTKVMTASAEPQTEITETSSSSSAPLTTTELTSPNERTSQELAGGYTFTQTKYYPLDSKKSYSDFTLTKSDSSDTIDTSDEAKAIENKLKEKLPVIDETITVKDGSKVTFETYKKGSVFYTILLYDKVPFGYVSTEDGVTTSYVTSYYVKNVMKEN
ncbi:MAG: hypothetical protein D8H99_72595 [Streptococcus sp.]|nr:MAG: hypothetical protein D8H99_72595 [Streptococcus sp.]